MDKVGLSEWVKNSNWVVRIHGEWT